MELKFDEDLIEAVVLRFAGIGGPPRVHPRQAARFHRARESAYSIANPDQRNEAFLAVQFEWFCEWEAAAPLRGVMGEFEFEQALTSLVIGRARTGKAEGAELYVSPEGRRNAILALCPARFVDPPALKPFARHEMTHLDDMLNPQFGYSPGWPADITAGRQARVRERYRVAWDSSIDGRLSGRGRTTVAGRDERKAEFDLAFGFLDPAERAKTFDRLWSGQRPCHRELMTLAAGDDGERAGAARQDLCPLCGFPTCHWSVSERLDPAVVARIGRDFPRWNPRAGACYRCAEVYAIAASSDEAA